MKKIKFTGKLTLNKETISKLNNEQMNHVIGGSGSVRCGTNTCATSLSPTECDPQPTLNCTELACPTENCLTTMRGGGPC